MQAHPLPTLYISHGSPMTALDGGAAGQYWRDLGPAYTAAFGKPKAILVASAHSLTREPVLLAAERHEAVYDFGGFPDALYQLRYDAAGAPALAERVATLLRESGLPVHVANEGGMDHGIWTPLRSMYPDADIPVLPLAWPPNWSPEQLFKLGQALAPSPTTCGCGPAGEAPSTRPNIPNRPPSATGSWTTPPRTTGPPCSTTASKHRTRPTCIPPTNTCCRSSWPRVPRAAPRHPRCACTPA
jgi:hypothetical protein